MDTTATEEQYFTIRELSRKWRLERHAVYKLVTDVPGVIRVYSGLGERPRYRVPESVARKIEQGLFRVNQGVNSNE